MSIICGPKWPYYSCDWIYWIYCTVWDRYMHVLYLGRAPRTKETLPDFREKCRVARHSRVFRGLTGSQRTPGNWGITDVPTDDELSSGSPLPLSFSPVKNIRAKSRKRASHGPAFSDAISSTSLIGGKRDV